MIGKDLDLKFAKQTVVVQFRVELEREWWMLCLTLNYVNMKMSD